MISLSSSAERYSQAQNKTFLADCNTLFSELFPNDKLENTPVSAYEWRKVFFERREILKEILNEQTGGMVEISIESPQAFYESFWNYLKIKKWVKFVNLAEQLIPQDKDVYRAKILEETIQNIKSKVAANINKADGIYTLIDGNKHDIAAKRIEPENLIALVEKTNKVEWEQKRKVVLNYLSQSRENWQKADVIIDFFSGITEEQFVAFAANIFEWSIHEEQSSPQVDNLLTILCNANVKKIQILFWALDSKFLADLIWRFPQAKLQTLKSLFAFAETQRLIHIFEEVPFEKIYGFLLEISHVKNFTSFLEITQVEKVIWLLSTDTKSRLNLPSIFSDTKGGVNINKFAEFVNSNSKEVILECFNQFKHLGILFWLINSGLFPTFLSFVDEKNPIKDVSEKIYLLWGTIQEKVSFFAKMVMNVWADSTKEFFATTRIDGFEQFRGIVWDDSKLMYILSKIWIDTVSIVSHAPSENTVRGIICTLLSEIHPNIFMNYVSKLWWMNNLIQLFIALPAIYSVNVFMKYGFTNNVRYLEFLSQADIQLLKKIFEGGESSVLLQRLKDLLDGKEVRRNFFKMNQGPYTVQQIIKMMK